MQQYDIYTVAIDESGNPTGAVKANTEQVDAESFEKAVTAHVKALPEKEQSGWVQMMGGLWECHGVPVLPFKESVEAWLKR